MALTTMKTVPMNNIDAEQALVGAALYDVGSLELAGDLVTGAHFGDRLLGWLFDKIRELVSRQQSVAPIVLHEMARAYGTEYEDRGGLSYLSLLAEQCGNPNLAGDHARIIHDCAVRRDLMHICSEGSHAALMERDRPASEIVADLRGAIEQVEMSGVAGDAWSPAGAAVRRAIAYAQSRTGRIDYPTGIPSLDQFTGGLNAGEVTLLAARPGMGKTVGALTIARANAEHGLGVCVFSLEMTENALGLRLACDIAFDRSATVYSGEPTCPTFNRAMKGELQRHQWAQLEEANHTVDGWSLMIDDRSGLTMQQIEGAARRQHRKWERLGIKPGPVIIDHLGKVKPSNDRRGNKHAEVADVSNDAAVMAKRLGVPVLGLVQLNRAVESRDGNRPQLSDLRQAGELEEDARQVMFLYRPEYYVKEPVNSETFEERTARIDKLQACKNQLFWLVEKNSHGPLGQVQSFCEIACSAIREW